MEYSQDYQIGIKEGFHMRPCMKAYDFILGATYKKEKEGLEFIITKENGEQWSSNEPSFVSLSAYSADLVYKKPIKITTRGELSLADLKSYNQKLGELITSENHFDYSLIYKSRK